MGRTIANIGHISAFSSSLWGILRKNTAIWFALCEK
jgi:hypothetical protein